MRTIRLLLGNSEQLLTNFIEVLVQDACADEGLVETSSARTVEAVILKGLTGRFDLGIIIPNNLIADRAPSSRQDAFSEAAQAIHILKKRCSMPIVATAAFRERCLEERLLWEAGADRVLPLPFHPDQFARIIRDMLRKQAQPLPCRRPTLYTGAGMPGPCFPVRSSRAILASNP